MYLKDGVYLGTYSNNDYVAPVDASENFGLDDYEPDFFLDALTWNSAEYSVALKFDVSDFDDDIFYFCHVSNKMMVLLVILWCYPWCILGAFLLIAILHVVASLALLILLRMIVEIRQK
jgi:hypothetical protein